MKEIEIAPPTTVKVKRGKKKTTFVEQPQADTADEVFHTPKVNPAELQALLDRDAPLERVVVRCNRETKKWELWRNNEPYKQLDALILINVSFTCSVMDKDERGRYLGCGSYVNGTFTGFATGDMLPVSTPLSVPTEGVVRLRFNKETGNFYNPDTGDYLEGAGYLILKENCSSEYVNADALGAKGKE